MKPISSSIDINASPEMVWTMITDIDHYSSLLSTIESAVRIDTNNNGSKRRGSFTVGTGWKETRSVFGQRESMELYVTSLDNSSLFPKSYTAEGDSHGVHYKTTVCLEGIVDNRSCRLSMETHGAPTNILSHVMIIFTGECTRRATCAILDKDMDEIKRAAEEKVKLNR